jgi:serine/threonine protein phosphatase PrpC
MQAQSESNKNKRKRANVASDESLVYAAMSDVGLERSVNEDRCSTFATQVGECFLVLDGMGGSEGGEFAAQISADTIQRYLTVEHQEDIAERIRDACEEANRTIMLRRQSQRFTEMGTTVVGVLIEDSAVAVAHVGDSRAYLVQHDGIQQLTVDHTYVQQLVDRNEITREDALPHPQSHILTQCLGSSPDIKVDVERYWIWPLKKSELSDFIVLCSDGLYSLVGDEEIQRIVTVLPPPAACEELIQLANSRGGFDNVTVSIIPLRGHLRAEESPTWEKELSDRARGRRVNDWWKRSFAYHIVIASLFAVGASVAALGLFFYLKVLNGF